MYSVYQLCLSPPKMQSITYIVTEGPSILEAISFAVLREHECEGDTRTVPHFFHH